MFRLAVFFLISALFVPAVAHASTLDTFTVTGTGYTDSFDLASILPIASLDLDGAASYTSVPVIVNGATGLASITFYTNEDFSIFDGANVSEFISSTPFYITDPTMLTFTPGTYSTAGYTNCTSSLTMPNPGVLPTLAFFRLPVLSLHCGEEAQLTIAPNLLGITPEPASLVLFGTGAFGISGMIRRRFLS